MSYDPQDDQESQYPDSWNHDGSPQLRPASVSSAQRGSASAVEAAAAACGGVGAPFSASVFAVSSTLAVLETINATPALRSTIIESRNQGSDLADALADDLDARQLPGASFHPRSTIRVLAARLPGFSRHEEYNPEKICTAVLSDEVIKDALCFAAGFELSTGVECDKHAFERRPCASKHLFIDLSDGGEATDCGQTFVDDIQESFIGGLEPAVMPYGCAARECVDTTHRLDVDQFGPLILVGLGPFSEGPFEPEGRHSGLYEFTLRARGAHYGHYAASAVLVAGTHVDATAAYTVTAGGGGGSGGMDGRVVVLTSESAVSYESLSTALDVEGGRIVLVAYRLVDQGLSAPASPSNAESLSELAGSHRFPSSTPHARVPPSVLLPASTHDGSDMPSSSPAPAHRRDSSPELFAPSTALKSVGEAGRLDRYASHPSHCVGGDGLSQQSRALSAEPSTMFTSSPAPEPTPAPAPAPPRGPSLSPSLEPEPDTESDSDDVLPPPAIAFGQRVARTSPHHALGELHARARPEAGPPPAVCALSPRGDLDRGDAQSDDESPPLVPSDLTYNPVAHAGADPHAHLYITQEVFDYMWRKFEEAAWTWYDEPTREEWLAVADFYRELMGAARVDLPASPELEHSLNTLAILFAESLFYSKPSV